MSIRKASNADRPGPPPKHAHPLFWLLVLLALLALGWSFYNHRAGESMPAPIRPDIAPTAAPSPPPARPSPAATPPGTR